MISCSVIRMPALARGKFQKSLPAQEFSKPFGKRAVWAPDQEGEMDVLVDLHRQGLGEHVCCATSNAVSP